MKIRLIFIGITFIIYYDIIANSSYNLEIFMHTCNTNGTQVVFNVTVNANKPIWNPETNLIDTDNFQNPASLIISGNDTTTYYGWHTDKSSSVYDGNPCLQWTYEYKIKVSDKSKELKVETFGYKGWDVDIMYDYGQDKYFIWNRSQKKKESETTSLNMRDSAEYLQPTSPNNLVCINHMSYNENPDFKWETPEHPENTSFTYNIYRDDGSGYIKINTIALSCTTYTDTGAELDKFGNATYYYVKAKGANSPLSDASNIVEINTDIASKPLPDIGSDQKRHNDQTTLEDISLLSIYPNPFNPTTKISYDVPKAGLIQIAVYNTTGQKVTDLVNEFKYPGEYSVNFEGQSLAGGVYFVRLLIDDQQVTRKILLFK